MRILLFFFTSNVGFFRFNGFFIETKGTKRPKIFVVSQRSLTTICHVCAI